LLIFKKSILVDKFRFTAAAAAAAAETAAANTENSFTDYLNSNHCQNNTVVLDNFRVAAAAAATAAAVTINQLTLLY
jgi:predicted nucleic acid-binding protein